MPRLNHEFLKTAKQRKISEKILTINQKIGKTLLNIDIINKTNHNSNFRHVKLTNGHKGTDYIETEKIINDSIHRMNGALNRRRFL